MSVLDDLAYEINKEHALIVAPGNESVVRAIKCGELLIEAQKSVAKGEWVVWMRENLTIVPTTAFKYMRLAKHKELVLGGDFSGIDPAIEHLSGRRQLSDEEKLEAIKLYKRGRTMQEIAELLNVRKSTVHYWVTAKDRNRTKRLQRSVRERAKRALQREEQAKQVKAAGGLAAQAYSFVRRAEQRVDQRLAEKDIEWEERRWLTEALVSLQKAEDELASAIRNRPRNQPRRGRG